MISVGKVEDRESGSLSKRRVGLSAGRARGPLIGLILFSLSLTLFFGTTVPGFASLDNAINIGQQMVVLGIAASGATLVIISGGLDLSVGAVAALSGVISAVVARDSLFGGSMIAAWTAGVLVGAALGGLNSLVVVVLKINPLIATLGTQTIIRGTAFIITGGVSLFGVPEAFQALGRGQLIQGLSYSFIILILVVVTTALLLSQTRFGRYVYAIGGNPEAARESGVSVSRVQTTVYIIAGATAGLAGVLLASRLGSGQAASSAGLELTVITAVVLGGAPIFGGDGRIAGTFLGVFVLALLNNGLVLMNVSEFWQLIVRGVTLLVAIAMAQAGAGKWFENLSRSIRHLGIQSTRS